MDGNVKKSEIGISTFDVDYCVDINDLFKWKFKLEYHLTDLEEQIKIKEFMYRNAKSVNKEEWVSICKTKKYRKYQSILYNQINRKITVSKKAKHLYKMQIERDFWKDKIKNIISDNDFKDLCLLLE